MSLEKMEALEGNIRRLVVTVQELREANGLLKQELEEASYRLMKQDELLKVWEKERSAVRTRIEKVLGELDILECSGNELQGVAHVQDH